MFIICIYSIFATIYSASALENITIFAKQIHFSSVNPKQVEFDKLLWRGGLELSASSKNFGGISGLELSKDGNKLLAISDRGYWLKADIVYKDKKLFSLINSQIAPILNAKGKKFVHWKADSEGLAKRNDSLDDVVISVERDQAIYRFKFKNGKLNARAKELTVLANHEDFPTNRGLEGVTSLPPNHKYRGWLLTIAEKTLDKNGNHSAWLVNGEKNLSLKIKRVDDFSITDVNYLPNGDIVILERAISILRGPQVQIRQICGKDIKPGVLVAGEVLLNRNWVYAVDNMEGLAVHKSADDETILTLVSDNNFHFMQRNLMLQFALANDKSVCKG